MDEREAIIKFIKDRAFKDDVFFPICWSIQDELMLLAEELEEGAHIQQSHPQ